VCIDVLFGDVLSRRCFVEETFCMCGIAVPLLFFRGIHQRQEEVPQERRGVHQEKQ
jgi:hypothetical protein